MKLEFSFGNFGYKKQHVPAMRIYLYLLLALLLTGLLFPDKIRAQELEPRSLTNVPVGMNFVMAGYTWTQGNILLDPALSIEDLNATVHGIVAVYARSINVFGKSGKIDAVLPYAFGNWSGVQNQEQKYTSRHGLGDPRIRFSVNLYGSPALNMEEYKSYRQRTIVGFNMQVYLPVGQYFPDRLINLGSNRFTFKPQLGISHRFDKWYLEAYTNIWLFTINKEFYGGGEMKQKPVITGKVHVIRSLSKGMWIAANAGYADGGTASVNGVERESHISTFRVGGTFAIPIGLHHSLKLFGFTTSRQDKGSDYELLSLAYQFRWGGK
ncbi:MAG TPA: transporter [Bacteroides sp.]|nr:transporter [Bacteroides sp.]